MSRKATWTTALPNAAREPLSSWVAIALAFSLGVLVVVAAAMRPGIEWLKDHGVVPGVGFGCYQPCGGTM
jgi:hypothetical protein